jgi:tetratricopeptide (TPR) repeat protein
MDTNRNEAQCLERGNHHLEQGDLDAAFEEFAAAIELDPTSPRAIGGRGCVWHKRGDHDKALADYNHAIELDPGYARAYCNRGILSLEQGCVSESLADFDRAIKIAPEARFYFHRSRALVKSGERSRAMDDLNESIRLSPETAHGYFYRGIANVESNQTELAIENFTECLQRNGNHTPALVWRADELCKLGRYDDAVADLSQAIVQSRPDAGLYSRRGVALHYAKSYEAALADYDRVLEMNADHAKCFFNRGAALAALKEYDQAIADYDEAVKRDANNPAIYAARAGAWKELNELDNALKDLSHALLLNPRQPDVFNSRGQIWMRLGELDKALADFNDAIRQDAKHHQALQNRGAVCSELGQTENADADFEHARELRLLERHPEREPENNMASRTTRISRLLKEHLAPQTLDNITITERKFPFRVRADLQRAMDGFFSGSMAVVYFCGVRQEHAVEGLEMSGLLESDHNYPPRSVPPQYEELDIGEEEPIRCLKNGLWLLESGEQKFAVLLAPATRYGQVKGLKFQIATANSPDGTKTTQLLFDHLEEAVAKSQSYRGKILSLEEEDDRYTGKSAGLSVHKLNAVERDEVILPSKTLGLLDRNVIEFAKIRPKLSEMGLSTKKGLLFYGPPGTGKTHTIHYLAGSMEGHTTLILTAEQVGLLDEYMVLARLLQPSIVVIEDVDLIARNREKMGTPCEEVLLNRLLNEMDGLRPNTDVFFILTTNRPEALEQALASRPGRVDQAIEFPLPDDDGRRKLIRLYSRGIDVPVNVEDLAVKKTEGVSASFIKELMRRAAQFHLESSESKAIDLSDVENALEELLFSGGSLNRSLLGVREAEGSR